MQKLRQDRAWSHPDRSLAFMAQAFKKDVERPYKQLGDLATLWAELLPSELVEHTRLESLSRGVLRVIVDSAARHFELDGLLRQGLLTELIKQHRGPAFRRVQLRVGTLRS